MKERATEGLGANTRKQADVISVDEETALYDKGILGVDNPQQLLDTLLYLCGTVKRLCTSIGLIGKRTNHSLRASAATRLYNAGIEEQRVAETTGHRSKAVRVYKRTSADQQIEASNILYGLRPSDGSKKAKPSAAAGAPVGSASVECSTNESDKITVTCNFSFNFSGILEKDEYVIHLPPDITIGILKTKMIKTVEKIIYKIVLHAETFLLVLEISEQQSNQFYEASVTIAIHLPGYPTDFCFVSRNAGFLVSWRHDKEISYMYSRQHLFHFSTEGQLLGTIPFLGDSPFSFSPVFLDGDPSIQEKYPGYGTAGWYVYMRDGHGGILCVKLLDFY
ncbi:unnamed protein product [Mytilus coruscus]|uniref:Tyr recombinase domain-containing protein n=1 Tax=Mytilus coruscus TaxID=42192 RepID=A0A6J8CUL6_MYTCO|nr:unnamed protein product [Mytilus coruscus]